MVVLAGIAVIVIGEFGQILHSPVALLEDGDADGHVVGSFEVLPVLVLQVALFDVSEELGVECAEVTGHEGVVAVVVPLDGPLGEGARVAQLSEAVHDEVGVYEPSSVGLELGVEQFEHLPAEQFVVAIDHQKYLFALAELVGSPPQIEHGFHRLLIPHHAVSVRPYHLLLPQKLRDILPCPVGRAVVDYNDVEVGIVLHHDGADVSQVSVAGQIVVGGHNDAEGQFRVGVDLVFVLVVVVFLLGQVTHLEQLLVHYFQPLAGHRPLLGSDPISTVGTEVQGVQIVVACFNLCSPRMGSSSCRIKAILLWVEGRGHNPHPGVDSVRLDQLLRVIEFGGSDESISSLLRLAITLQFIETGQQYPWIGAQNTWIYGLLLVCRLNSRRNLLVQLLCELQPGILLVLEILAKAGDQQQTECCEDQYQAEREGRLKKHNNYAFFLQRNRFIKAWQATLDKNLSRLKSSQTSDCPATSKC